MTMNHRARAHLHVDVGAICTASRSLSPSQVGHEPPPTMGRRVCTCEKKDQARDVHAQDSDGTLKDQVGSYAGVRRERERREEARQREEEKFHASNVTLPPCLDINVPTSCPWSGQPKDDHPILVIETDRRERASVCMRGCGMARGASTATGMDGCVHGQVTRRLHLVQATHRPPERKLFLFPVQVRVLHGRRGLTGQHR
mmetsp:Transcript_10589/g.65185  ORF Transcript_10589/g.65185 Transcript_10589/m.65185 type:complete len:200 (+) Transcript_10589:11937-12536(+)